MKKKFDISLRSILEEEKAIVELSENQKLKEVFNLYYESLLPMIQKIDKMVDKVVVEEEVLADEEVGLFTYLIDVVRNWSETNPLTMSDEEIEFKQTSIVYDPEDYSPLKRPIKVKKEPESKKQLTIDLPNSKYHIPYQAHERKLEIERELNEHETKVSADEGNGDNQFASRLKTQLDEKIEGVLVAQMGRVNYELQVKSFVDEQIEEVLNTHGRRLATDLTELPQNLSLGQIEKQESLYPLAQIDPLTAQLNNVNKQLSVDSNEGDEWIDLEMMKLGNDLTQLEDQMSAYVQSVEVMVADANKLLVQVCANSKSEKFVDNRKVSIDQLGEQKGEKFNYLEAKNDDDIIFEMKRQKRLAKLNKEHFGKAVKSTNKNAMRVKPVRKSRKQRQADFFANDEINN